MLPFGFVGEMLQVPYTANSSPLPAPSGGSSLSSTLRRFASRTRLFSRVDHRYHRAYVSMTQAEDDEEEPTAQPFEGSADGDRKPLVPKGVSSTAPLRKSTRSAPSTASRSTRRTSVRRLAQGRQRLLKRNSPSGGVLQTPPPTATLQQQQQPSIDAIGSTKKRESLRLRKVSKTQPPPPMSTSMPMEQEWAEQQQQVNRDQHTENVPPVVRRFTTDETAGNARPDSTVPSGVRVVSFVQRRRRTASFKSRVSRPPNWRHSMRVGRTATLADDEATADLLKDTRRAPQRQQQQQQSKVSMSLQCQQHSPPEAPRSPVFMLSIARKANIGGGGRLQVTQHSQQQQHSPERFSSSTTATSAVAIQQQRQQQQQLADAAEEEDEEEMYKNMPWLCTLLQFVQKMDFDCSHEQFCTKWCFERIYRQCQRLFEALMVVYGQTTADGRLDRRQQFIERWQNSQQREAKKRHSSNPPRRESANVRQSGVDRMPLALRGLIIEKLSEIEENRAKKAEETDQSVNPSELRLRRPPQIVNFVRVQMLGLVHAPLSALLKGVVVLKADQLIPSVRIAWTLLIASDDANLVATAAALFICCAVKCPQECTNLMAAELASADPSVRTSAVLRFFVLWRQRYHVWLKMEDGSQLIFKIPPPSIDFTLPSPSIGLSQLPVVDPPWMPPVKTKVEELSLKEEEQSTSQTIMTMTRTRRKQKQEMVRKAIRRADERQRELREQFPLRATAVVQQVAYEPALFQHQLTSADSSQVDDPVLLDSVHQARQVVPVAQPLFPSSILSVVPTIVELLDDPQVDGSGISVGETCRRVIWSCLVEDTALFLRHFFEKLTNRPKQEYLLALLRRLVLSFRPLPSQTAHTLLNALFGLAMFYVRTPGEGSDRSLALALSMCWLVVPFVHGLYFKDLKQTLKKEQCDQAIMVTANVPSAKKVIVHGPDSQQGGIPTQFPVLEDTQFQHLLADSIEFYNISAEEADQHFLYDPKTFMLHNPNAYVRDFYFFHRSFYPQLQLVRLDAPQAQQRIREHAVQQKLIETGKVLLTHNALRHSHEAVIPQRIFFLHDEFTHLPSFPRRAVETCFGMYQGTSGEELQTMDALHKFAWSKLIANMFEKMENAFMFGDLHLFINVINGIMIIHCEDVLILRRCMAAYLGMSIHFNSLFASQGFSLIMPTILRCYSQRQPNRLFTQVVEFVCKQFYVLHPNPMRVKAKYLFALLLAMEQMNEPVDQLDILAMLPHPKPLQALDLCYRDEPSTFNFLTDAMASCVTICAFAPETRRAHQMLLCMQSLLPHLIRHMEEETSQRQQQAAALAALKLELSAFATLSVELRALVNSCEALARGPTRSFDLAASAGGSAGAAEAGTVLLAPAASNQSHAAEQQRRGRSLGGGGTDSPQFFDPPTIVEDEVSRPQQSTASAKTEKKVTVSGWADGTTAAAADNEALKEQFRGPRDALLTLCSMFVRLGSDRLKELGRLSAGLDHSRGGMPELFDHKCHVKLSEVAVALLKLAPYDGKTLSCGGLRHYFTDVMPVIDWSVETNRSAVNIILRRLDKTIAKIAKRPSTRRRANWGAISFWLVGLQQTLLNSPYIAHLHSLKTITLLCLRLTLGDPFGTLDDQTVQAFTLSTQQNSAGPGSAYLSSVQAPQTVLSPHTPPESFCSVVLRLTSFLMTTLGQLVFSLELICSADNIGPLADRPEAILCQFLIPLFLRAAISGKEAPQFRTKDLNFCLNLIQNAISTPSLAKQSVAPAMSGSSLATSLMRDSAGGRQGSVSVTDRGGYSATVSTARIMRDSVVQTVMLALKVIVIAFHKQLTITQWMRIARIVRELVAKKGGGAALSPFLKFMLGANLPIAELLQSIVQNRLNQRTVNDVDTAWVGELRERIARIRSDPVRKAHFAQLRSLHRELHLLREDFVMRNLEIPRSHTPTIGGELHSDSGSSQGVGTGAVAVRGESTARRLSSSALGKLRWIQSKAGDSERSQGPKVSLTGTLHDSTIVEDAEDENASGDGGEGAADVGRRERRSLGMFRSVRRLRKPRLASLEGGSSSRDSAMPSTGGMELGEVGGSAAYSHRSSSLKRGGRHDERQPGKGAENSPTGAMSTPSQISINKLDGERPRVVSFSTPRHSSVSQTISEADSDGTVEFCITSTKHLECRNWKKSIDIITQMSLFCSTTAPIYGPCVLGLQLIGVYAIILFHIWPSEFCNGFMGVDILFVVFGFLMSIKLVELYNDAGNNNTVTLVPASTSSANNSLSYYDKFLPRFVYEIRRFYYIEFTQIIPLNLTLILGSLVGGFVFFLDDEMEQLRKDSLWALCFGTNHQLTDVDWTFDLIGISQPRPLLHLWAICVKIQFVLALSPPVLLLVRLKSGTKSASFKCQIVQLSALFLLLILPSFLFWLSSTSKSVMMGWACSRAWQFLLGTMSALIANQNRRPKCQINEQSKKCLLFSIIVEHLLFYLAAVCLGVVFFLPSVFWPPFFQYKTILTISISALTAFLLYFFINRLKQKIPLSALSQWLFVNFGQFPLFCFLFHQPLAVFLRSFLTVSQLNIFEGFLAILLITLSSLLVQQIFHKLFANIRQQKCFSSLCVYLIIFGYAFCALFAIAPGTIRLNQKRKNETPIPIFDEAQHKVQFWPLDVDSVRKFLEQLQTEAYQNELSPLLNSFAKVKINEMLKNSFTFDTDIPGTSADLFVHENEMAEDNRHVKRIYEWMLKGNGTRRVLLFGNSHAQVAWREVETSLEGNFSWLHVVSVPGCMPLFENDWRTIYGIRCSQTVKGLLKVAEKTLPDFLFLIFRWYDDLQPQGEPTNLELDPNLNEMQSFMDKLQRFVSGRIFISAPNLQFDTEISHQLAKRIWQNNSLEGLNKNYSKHLEENNSSYQRLGRLRCAKCSVFDLAKEFCWDGICHAFEPGSQLAYFSDRNHLSFLGRLKARETFAKIARSIEEGGERK
uniref:Uncharacterized protein n=1 Tax=Globodera rostochiensis TaxID=31243 RepID=A0A914HFS7_GLORO